jgi:hypothetical protein
MTNETKITPELFEALEALCKMYNQYCPPPTGHLFMSAGEEADDVLYKYGLTKGDSGYGGVVDWNKLEEYKKKLGIA